MRQFKDDDRSQFSMSIIHDPHDYEYVFCSVKRVREGIVFLVLSPRELRRLFISLGHVTILIRAKIFW